MPAGPSGQQSNVTVKSVAGSHVQIATQGVEVGERIVQSLMEISALQRKAGESEECSKLREGAIRVLRARYLMSQLKGAASSIKNSYNPTANETDFDAMFTQIVQTAANYDSSKDEMMKQFDMQQDVTQQGEERIDDDIAIENSGPELAKNVKCPITMKALLDLDDPVVDKVGFVYERAAILSMLRNARHSSMKCPVAGTVHTIDEKELRPATAVLMEKRRVARFGKRRAHIGDDGDGGDEDEYDVVVD